MIKGKISKVIIFGLLLAIIFSVTGCAKEEVEGVVAIVNGEEITEEAFLEDFEVYKSISIQQYGEDALTQAGEDGRTLEDVIREDVLEKLIIEMIVEEEAKKLGIEVTTEEVEEPLEGYITMLGGSEQFETFLEVNNITREYFIENLRKEMVYGKHREHFLENTSVDESEIEEYFETHKDDLTLVRAKHILLKTEEEGKEALERLNNGEKFDKLAHELSFDKASAELGGDLGYFGKGEMIAEFEEAAFNLEVGETSGLVKTEVGYHIIYLEEKLDDYDSLKDIITETLKQNKYYEEIENLRESADVEIF